MNSLPKTVTRQRLDCDLNPGPSAPESSTLTARLPTSYTVLSRNSGICKNKGTSLWNFIPNSGLRKFRYGKSIVLSTTLVDGRARGFTPTTVVAGRI